MNNYETVGLLPADETTCYARNTGGDWHIVPGFARLAMMSLFGRGVCGMVFRIGAATDTIREAGDAPACPACLRYFYRQDDKRP